MNRGGLFAAALLSGSLAASHSASGQNAVADFYRGKTFTVIIGSAPGGGYDAYGRLIARFLGRHIPGNPTVVPQNMPGASSKVAAAYMYNIAASDGLAMAGVTAGALMEPLLGERTHVKFDASKFNYVGNATKDVYVCVARKDAPVQTFSDIFTKQLIVGGAAAGGSTRDFPLLLRNVLGAKFRIISGYPGNGDVLVAIDRGEVQGVCGNSYAGLQHLRPAWFRPGGAVRVIAQEDVKGYPALNKQGAPLTIDFAKTDEERQIITLVYQEPVLARPYIMAPRALKERVAAIQTAFSRDHRGSRLSGGSAPRKP